MRSRPSARGMRDERTAGVYHRLLPHDRADTTRADDASLRHRMRAIALERRRFGYRRLHVFLLKREGYLVDHKKLFRLYREEKLTVRRRGGRKQHLGPVHG